jgi:enamine deaminase RidA (YjgF/YER057c/UK114 family)
MSIERFSTGAHFERRYGYSRAVRAGSLIFVSGTTPADDALTGDVADQFASAVARVEASLAAFGATRANIVRTVVYVRDITGIDAVCAAHSEAFGDFPPASTVVEVSGLVPPKARVELEVTAVLDG